VTEHVSFHADAAIIDRLGRELVARQETALTELIKNSYDADATEVIVAFDGIGADRTLEIRDNGLGMTRQDVTDGFLRLASDLKVRSPVSPRYLRRRAGRKGIGRFATQRLGTRLILSTCSSDAEQGIRLTVDWTQFVAGTSLEQIALELEDAPSTPSGTTIRIEGLRDEWTDAQVRRAWRDILALQQPFPVAPVENRPEIDPGFSVRFVRHNVPFRDEDVVTDLQTEILDHLHAEIELRVDSSGHALWRISKNKFGETRDWTPIHHEHRDDPDPPSYAHLRNAWMKAHYVVLLPELLPSLVYTRIRDVLAMQGGIRLYRNGFRVVPYGDPGNDWLQLDEIYAKRSLLAPLANRNFFGIIEVRDPAGAIFEEHTSREGLIETAAFGELKGLASSVLVTAATRLSEDRGRKGRAGAQHQRVSSEAAGFDEIRAAVAATQQAVEGISQDGQAAAHAADVVRLLDEKQEEFVAARAQLADETAALRFLATLGMTLAEFSHETGMTFEACRLDFERVFDAVVTGNPGNTTLLAQAQRAKAMLTRLDTLTSYLNALAGARAARAMHPISLSRALQDFERGMVAQAKSQGIGLEVTTPAYDPLFTRPMHEAEIASVLLNFYTNAVKALKRSPGDRRILVEGDRLGSAGMVRLRFCDTGDGISDDIRERVFDPFFTTRIAPPAGAPDAAHATGAGLGLWIVKQIASNSGGDVSVSIPPAGFATCLEFLIRGEDEAE
jgi:signal transduction histidine kinase